MTIRYRSTEGVRDSGKARRFPGKRSLALHRGRTEPIRFTRLSPPRQASLPRRTRPGARPRTSTPPSRGTTHRNGNPGARSSPHNSGGSPDRISRPAAFPPLCFPGIRPVRWREPLRNPQGEGRQHTRRPSCLASDRVPHPRNSVADAPTAAPRPFAAPTALPHRTAPPPALRLTASRGPSRRGPGIRIAGILPARSGWR